jgi:hypothetical protein
VIEFRCDNHLRRRINGSGSNSTIMGNRWHELMESDSEYEDALHRDLFLAARCLGGGARTQNFDQAQDAAFRV